MALLFWTGSWVDGYRLHVVGEPLPHPYPWRGVLGWGAAVSLEALVIYLVIRPETYRRSWRRALSATVVAAVLAVYFGAALMHMPPFIYAHWLWLAVLTLGCFSLFVVSALRAARGRWRSVVS